MPLLGLLEPRTVAHNKRDCTYLTDISAASTGYGYVYWLVLVIYANVGHRLIMVRNNKWLKILKKCPWKPLEVKYRSHTSEREIAASNQLPNISRQGFLLFPVSRRGAAVWVVCMITGSKLILSRVGVTCFGGKCGWLALHGVAWHWY